MEPQKPVMAIEIPQKNRGGKGVCCAICRRTANKGSINVEERATKSYLVRC